MRKLIYLFFFLMLPYAAYALLSMELTRGVAGAIPVAVLPFTTDSKDNVSPIITTDLKNSGQFKLADTRSLTVPTDAKSISPDLFKKLSTDNIVLGEIKQISNDRFTVHFQLIDLYGSKDQKNSLLNQSYTVSGSELRAVAHHISDLVYQKLTGVRGVFSTKLAYVVVQRGVKTQYVLEVADQDGYNPRTLLRSYEPIMSPAWSPNGKQLAYVSFERRRASIYLHDVVTGARQLLSEFPGINGAPAWSLDGKKLALVLSKSGSPNIYVMDIGSRQLSQVTNNFYINTEPAWSADGQSLLFTSNRGGGPQVYEVNLASRKTARVSYDGDYNARPSYTYNGKNVAMIHRVSGIYNIALLDLDNGTTRVLTASGSDSASPSVAPNGSMILYDTYYRGRNVLAMVSADGRVQLVLPARNGEAQDPAWSPFLS